MNEHHQEQKVEKNYKTINIYDMKEFNDKTFIVFDKAFLDYMLCGKNVLVTV